MKRDLAAISGPLYDLLVIGGGIYGASVAWDAVLRGLSVALVDKADFGGATSANSLKIIHGGFRYLQHGDLRRLRDSSRERRTLMHIAPHLVHPLPVVIPTYGHLMTGREVFAAALLVNDILTADRNRLDDPQKHIPRGRLISRAEMTKLVPGIMRDGLTGGAVFYDAQVYNSERLLMSFLHSASAGGAVVANYIEVTGFLRDKDAVAGVDARDALTEERLQVRARMVVNTAGPWVNRVVRFLGPGRIDRRLRFAQAFNLITRSVCDGYAVGIPSRSAAEHTGASRFLFIAPWRGRSIIGTAYAPYDGDPDSFSVSERSILDFLDEINRAYPAAQITPADVTCVQGGLLPVSGDSGDGRPLRLTDTPLVYDHRDEGVKGLLSVVGVKYTTARNVAERVVHDVFRALGRIPPRSRSAAVPLYGGTLDGVDAFVAAETARRRDQLDEDATRRLVRNYGSACPHVLRYLPTPERADVRMADCRSILTAEIRHAIHEEMAVSLGDVVFRRTDLGTAGHPGEEVLRLSAAIMGKEMGWTAARIEQELDAVERTFVQKHSTVRGHGPTVAGAAVQ